MQATIRAGVGNRRLRRIGPVFLLLAAQGAAAESPEPIAQLEWLAGCWTRSSADGRIDEQWMRPEGGAMLGMGRTVARGAMREYEFMRIEARDGRLVFTAKPSGQPEASFASIEVGPSRVVFENPAHDFPQRVIYARGADGSLQARIEGLRDGKPSGVDFRLTRTACPDGA